MQVRSLAALALAAVVAAPPALAQPGPGPGPAPGAGPRFGRGGRLSDAERGALRERVQQKIQTFLTVELATRAGLDEKKAVQLGNAIKAHMERRQQTREQKRQEMQKLRELVDGKASDAALKAQIKAIVGSPGREQQMQQLIDETGKFLTPTEQAKIVIALPEVMRDMRRMIHEARRERMGDEGGFDDDLDD